MNDQIIIDGSDLEWEQKCSQNTEARNTFVLINFTRGMVPFCKATAKKHGYELRGHIPATKTGACHFTPHNYAKSNRTLPDDFIFSVGPED